MRKITTKYGHEWECPETLEEFKAAGFSMDNMVSLAMSSIKVQMCCRSKYTHTGKYSTWDPSLPNTGCRGRKRIDPKQQVTRITAKLTPEQREALLAELQKEAK